MSDQSNLWGLSPAFWDVWGLRLMVVGGIFGLFALIASVASAYILYRVADVAQKDLERTSSANALELQLQKKATAEANARAEEAREATKKLELRQHARFFIPPKFKEEVAGVTPFPVSIRYLADNGGEGTMAAMSLFMCLQVAGWKETPFPEGVLPPAGIPAAAFLGGFPDVITVKFNPSFLPAKRLADAIRASTPNADVLTLDTDQFPEGEVAVLIAPRP